MGLTRDTLIFLQLEKTHVDPNYSIYSCLAPAVAAVRCPCGLLRVRPGPWCLCDTFCHVSSLKTMGLGARAHRLKDHNVCGVMRVRGRIAAIVAREPQTQ